MPILLQILLSLFGSQIGGYMYAKLGGPKIEIGEPFWDSRPTVPISNSLRDEPIPAFSEGLPEPGTITYNLRDDIRKSGNIAFTAPSKSYIHINIYNKQKSKISDLGLAKNVFAKISFFDLNENIINQGKKYDGRWEKSPQPKRGENVEHFRFIDIEPDDYQALDIATQSLNGGYWYVWTSADYNNLTSDKLLSNDGFIFLLELYGRNFNTISVCYKIISSDIGGRPQIIKCAVKPAF